MIASDHFPRETRKSPTVARMSTAAPIAATRRWRRITSRSPPHQTVCGLVVKIGNPVAGDLQEPDVVRTPVAHDPGFRFPQIRLVRNQAAVRVVVWTIANEHDRAPLGNRCHDPLEIFTRKAPDEPELSDANHTGKKRP